ncbi:MAG: hypothetical protein CL447_01975 [Acidimicrobiaceae bacterium]|nr:hypothetical protein [Acidimicrobiaceae bacterium]
MGDVVQFKKKSAAEKHKGKTLCRSGFHKWEVVTEKQFDVEGSASWSGTFSCRNPRQGSITRLRGDWTEMQISAWAYGASSRVLEWC